MPPRPTTGKRPPPGPRRPQKTAKAPANRSRKGGLGWRRWLLIEAFVVAVGLALGLAVATWLSVRDAEADVRAWLAAPPRELPSTVWSGSSTIRPGQRVDLQGLVADLIAAGHVPGTAGRDDSDVYSLHEDDLTWWTRGSARRSLRAVASVVVHTEPADQTTVPPTPLAFLGDPERQRAPLDSASRGEWLPKALLAMEDTRFYRHPGIDPLGLLRAAWVSVRGSGGIQGGSTLTQQLAKNLFVGPERSMQRKVREAMYALAVERVLSKDQILGLYLGEVYLGQAGTRPVYGVDAAARVWFGVPARQVDAAQAALIVGVIPSPNGWSPTAHPDAARQRRDIVLRRMALVGALPSAEAARLANTSLNLSPLLPSRVRLAPYAVAAAVDAAAAALGDDALSAGGLRIRTTLDPALQREAERAVHDGLEAVRAQHPTAEHAQAALIALRASDGTVAAWVGGRKWSESPFDRVSRAVREAGSTVKALTLLIALDTEKALPSTLLDDAPVARSVDGKSWSPQNYDGIFVGPISVRRAVETSRNVPAVLLAESVGLGPLQRFFRSAGLSKATAWPSAALGAFSVTPLELAEAFTGLIDGVVKSPRLVRSIADRDDNLLVTIPSENRRIASKEAAILTTDVLRGVLTRGTGRGAGALGVGPNAAGKTGTTDAGRDAWFAGYTPDLVVVSWVGLDVKTLGLTGGEAAVPVWARFVAAAGPPSRRFAAPEQMQSICAETGLLARETCPESFPERVAKDVVTCDLHATAKVVALPTPAAASGESSRRRERRPR